MANYITCKDNRSFAYAETTNKGYYEVVSISEDGNTCHIKTVWHEDRNYINKEYDIPAERAAEDFTAVDEMVVIAQFEKQTLSVRGWFDEAEDFNAPYFSDIINQERGYTSTNFNCWNSRSYISTRSLLYIPNETSECLPVMSTYGATYKKSHIDEVSRLAHNSLTVGYDIAESFIVVQGEDFDAKVEAAKGSYEVIEYPAELKLQLRSVEHKVVVLKNNNHFVYLTNVDSDHIVFSSVVFLANQLGLQLDEDAKNALLNRSKIAYYTSIFKNIEAAFDNMQRKAKEKMFTDFGGQFNGMLIKPLRSAVDHARREYDVAQERVREMFTKFQDANARLFYAEHGVTDGEHEFMQFIDGAKDNIVSIKARPGDERIDFCIRTFLTYWDDDVWEIFRKSDSKFSRMNDWQKIMLDNIFKNRTIKLLIEQKFSLSTHYCEPNRISSYDSVTLKEGMMGLYNPHIHEYDCWGTHKGYIRDALKSSDYIQAYSQAVACISGLTLTDSPVMDKFMKYMNDTNLYNKPCLFDVATGKYMTINQYKETIKGQRWEK